MEAQFNVAAHLAPSNKAGVGIENAVEHCAARSSIIRFVSPWAGVCPVIALQLRWVLYFGHEDAVVEHIAILLGL